MTSPSHCLKPCRNGLYGFSSLRNSLDLCQEKDNESLLQVGSLSLTIKGCVRVCVCVCVTQFVSSPNSLIGCQN